jgi:RNA polymerase sigma-70 factor (ECF subfamily)
MDEFTCRLRQPRNHCFIVWPDQDQTRELLADAQRGDQRAVEKLLERHRRSLQRMVAARLHAGVARRVDASDVVQEALANASGRLADYLRNPQLPFHAWLRQITRDRLADVYRRQLAAKRTVACEQSVIVERSDVSAPAARVPDAELTPAAALLRKELAERFNQAVDELPDADREILLMRHSEQLTNSQAAELLGLSEAAAGMRYLRALRLLRAKLGETPSMWLE